MKKIANKLSNKGDAARSVYVRTEILSKIEFAGRQKRESNES